MNTTVELTQERVSNYVARGGVRCPFCDSEDVGGGFISIEPGVATQLVNCSSCDKEWTDIYKLHDIQVQS
jgi:transposase-like protein